MKLFYEILRERTTSVSLVLIFPYVAYIVAFPGDADDVIVTIPVDELIVTPLYEGVIV